MINCIIGSFIGTLIGITSGFYIIEWQCRKDLKKLEKLIEDMNTFKIKFKHEI